MISREASIAKKQNSKKTQRISYFKVRKIIRFKYKNVKNSALTIEMVGWIEY